MFVELKKCLDKLKKIKNKKMAGRGRGRDLTLPAWMTITSNDNNNVK